MIVNKTSSSNKRITNATIIPKDLCYNKIAYGNNGKVIGEAPYDYTPYFYEFEQIKEGAWEAPVEFKDKLFTFIPNTTQVAYYDFKTKIWNYYNTDFTLYKNAIAVSDDMIVFLHKLESENIWAGNEDGSYDHLKCYYTFNGIDWIKDYYDFKLADTGIPVGGYYIYESRIFNLNNSILIAEFYSQDHTWIVGTAYKFNKINNKWERFIGLPPLQEFASIPGLGQNNLNPYKKIKNYYIFIGDFWIDIYDLNFNWQGNSLLAEGSYLDDFYFNEEIIYYDDTNKILIIRGLDYNEENIYGYAKIDLDNFNVIHDFEIINIPNINNYNLFCYNGNYIATSNSSNTNSFYYSTDLENWETINTSFEITSTSKVVFKNNNIYFISNNIVYQSSNYTSWNQSNLSNGNWQILKDKNEIEYLITDSKFAYYSNNEWIEINLPITSNWKEIKIFRDNYFLFSDNKVLISQNLNNWGTQYRLNIYNHRIENGITAISAENAQPRELVVNNIQQTLTNNLPIYDENTNQNINYPNIIYQDGKYIAFGTTWNNPYARAANPSVKYQNSIFYSKNGINWEQKFYVTDEVEIMNSNYYGINEIFYINNKFYAVNWEYLGAYITSWESSDGINWESSNEFVFGGPNNFTIESIQTNSGKYIDLIENEYGERIEGLKYSYDGNNWINYNIPYYFRDLVYNKNNNVTVATTTDSIFTSLDTETWTSQTINPSNSFSTIECHNGIFIINCENSDSVYISEDGLNWELTNQDDYRVWKAYNGIQINGNQTKINKTVLRFKDEATIIPVENTSSGDYSPYKNNTICISYTN